MDVKKDIFTRLDEVTEDSAILASNTSSLSITELAAVTKKPQNVIGMHFMNPVPVMQLVEVIRGLEDNVYMYDVSPEQIEKGMKRISGQLFRQAEKGKLPHEDVKQIYQRLSPSAALDEAREAFLIIEAAVEILTLMYELKRRGGGIGIAAICSGGGQGDAVMIEV
ncbi:hypothetical protein DT075_00100 [Bacillus licheniformis]|nr:hypothetical protein DT075_00100 [Bacillus licheniformis]